MNAASLPQISSNRRYLLGIISYQTRAQMGSILYFSQSLGYSSNETEGQNRHLCFCHVIRRLISQILHGWARKWHYLSCRGVGSHCSVRQDVCNFSCYMLSCKNIKGQHTSSSPQHVYLTIVSNGKVSNKLPHLLRNRKSIAPLTGREGGSQEQGRGTTEWGAME